jgi:hypothetical protein
MQAIKALRMRPLHGHLVRERPKIVPKLYEQFTKIRKSVVQQFHKLEQHRKTSKAMKPQGPFAVMTTHAITLGQCTALI